MNLFIRATWRKVQMKYPQIVCVGCAAHWMHLIIMDASKDSRIKWFGNLIAKCSAIVNFFSKRPAMRHK